MPAFKDQVEDLISLSISDDAELSQFLTDGVIDVTNRCLTAKPQDIFDFTTVSVEQTGNGLDLGGAEVVSVIRESGVNGNLKMARSVSFQIQE